MNASALLTSQGWLGPGHALDSRLTDYGAPTYKQKGHRGLAYDPNANTDASAPVSSGNGLVKPLLVSQRGTSRHGIGKKVHEPPSGTEWWLKGFQSALQNIGKSESERSSAVNSGTSTPRNGNASGSGYVGKHSGLYGYFVTGQMMKGTLEDERHNMAASRKRKSDVLEEEAARDPLAVSPVKRVQTAGELEASVEYLKEMDKGRRGTQKQAQSTGAEQFAVVGRFLNATDDATRRKKKDRSKEIVETLDTEGGVRGELKEERRARRKRRKEERGKGDGTGNLTLAQMVEEELARLSSMNNTEDDVSAAERDVKTAKKVERHKKRQKEKD